MYVKIKTLGLHGEKNVATLAKMVLYVTSLTPNLTSNPIPNPKTNIDVTKPTPNPIPNPIPNLKPCNNNPT